METTKSLLTTWSKRGGESTQSIIKRRFRNRARSKHWLAPEAIQSDFYKGVTKLSDMQAFYDSADLNPHSPEQPPEVVEGFCYVCQQEVGFIVNTEMIRRDSNWRETMNCPKCGLINRWRSSVHVFEALVQPMEQDRIYLTEAITPLYKQIASRLPGCTGSEYIEGKPRGAKIRLPSGLTRNEDVTRLTFPDGSFEAVLSFDVLEHVPDFKQALREFYRVLTPGGQALISVPFTFRDQTVTRAELGPEGAIKHLMEPVYHGDPLSDGGVLCYYEFGLEFLKDLRDAGFQEAYLLCFASRRWGYYGANMMFVGRKHF